MNNSDKVRIRYNIKSALHRNSKFQFTVHGVNSQQSTVNTQHHSGVTGNDIKSQLSNLKSQVSIV
ncbi:MULTISPECIES: hypothetical protein [unclassified Microcoleus]|uniref:hypothetical protein n=1 Tax=unclassified Microcoleus TaxID=2642155 RepID=UPI002FD712FB